MTKAEKYLSELSPYNTINGVNVYSEQQLLDLYNKKDKELKTLSKRNRQLLKDKGNLRDNYDCYKAVMEPELDIATEIIKLLLWDLRNPKLYGFSDKDIIRARKFILAHDKEDYKNINDKRWQDEFREGLHRDRPVQWYNREKNEWVSYVVFSTREIEQPKIFDTGYLWRIKPNEN